MGKKVNVSAWRSEKFKQTALDISNYLDALPLNHEQNNKLIALIFKNINAAERDAFGLGLTIAGYAAALAAKENRQPTDEDIDTALKVCDAVLETTAD